MAAVIRLTPEHAAALLLASQPATTAGDQSVRQYTLPWPVSVNDYYRAVAMPTGAARVILSRAARRYHRRVAVALIEQRARAAPPGRLALQIDAHPPIDNKLHDLDNLLKSLCDAMMRSGIYPCDGAIDHISITRRSPTPGGLVAVAITPYLPKGE